MHLVWIQDRHLPLLIPIQINAWNINKCAIIITQILKKFAVMKPRMWMIFHGSSSWQLQILEATMYVNNRRAQRPVKHYRKHTAICYSMWIVGCGDNHNVWNIVFSLCMSQCLVKVRDTARSLLHCSPSNTCCWGNHNLKPRHTTA